MAIIPNSIKSELNSIKSNISNIRSTMSNIGITFNSSDNLSSFSTKINNKNTELVNSNNLLTSYLNAIKTSLQNKGVEVNNDYSTYASKIDDLSLQPNLQVKTVTVNANTPTISVIEADANYDGLSKVTVDLTYIESELSSILDTQVNSIETINITSNGLYDVLNYARALVTVDTVNNTTLSVNPATSQQTFTPNSSYTGYSNVTVNAVTSSIDNNIQANNIKQGVSILGISGNVVELNGQTKTITSNGAYTPDSGYNAFSSVTVNVPQPSGTKYITTNGTYDVSSYASANVTVSSGGSGSTGAINNYLWVQSGGEFLALSKKTSLSVGDSILMFSQSSIYTSIRWVNTSGGINNVEFRLGAWSGTVAEKPSNFDTSVAPAMAQTLGELPVYGTDVVSVTYTLNSTTYQKYIIKPISSLSPIWY